MMTWIVALVLALQPQPDIARDEVDLIEVNHFHDAQGRLVFDQVIFYDWSDAYCRYLVRAWRLFKVPEQYPTNNVTRWHDGDTLRMVRCKVVRESWTQHDPELVAREYMPKERRRELLPLRWAIHWRD